MDKIEIILKNGKWLINGKQYRDLGGIEKIFFEEFLIAMKLNFEEERTPLNPQIFSR